ncbi:MAG: HDOD domain-containing protein [Burkholderiaceae bacterium]|nr:HDOD domain-containing protein [Burkholderiaceae bacterium]MDH3459368.1 HDOD domain-containing protein [Burkholderiaceae bacterium]
MADTSVLEQVALCYAPFIDRECSVMATRLSAFPLKSGVAINVQQFLDAVAQVWPLEGGKVSLNVLSESLLQDLIGAEPSANLMVEVPSFMANDPALSPGLQALHARGNVLLLKGRPTEQLPRELLPCFTYSIIDLAEDRRLNQGTVAEQHIASRSIPTVQSGVRTMAELDQSFGRGVAAVVGWPIDGALVEPKSKTKQDGQGDLQVIVELIHRIDREEPMEKMEQTLRRDPTLAFKLLRYINSPAFGLRVEIQSFAHALMMLGYQRLKRWLALLLATAHKDSKMKPVMFAAVRRGLLMEELARTVGDEEMRSEMFICGVFSLLDRMFNQPFSQLLKTVPVPARVVQALGEGNGPYAPYLDLVRAVENESPFDVCDAAEKLLLGTGEVNRALLTALGSASKL